MVEGARLESVYTSQGYRGFESLPLCKRKPATKVAVFLFLNTSKACFWKFWETKNKRAQLFLGFHACSRYPFGINEVTPWYCFESFEKQKNNKRLACVGFHACSRYPFGINEVTLFVSAIKKPQQLLWIFYFIKWVSELIDHHFFGNDSFSWIDFKNINSSVYWANINISCFFRNN